MPTNKRLLETFRLLRDELAVRFGNQRRFEAVYWAFLDLRKELKKRGYLGC